MAISTFAGGTLPPLYSFSRAPGLIISSANALIVAPSSWFYMRRRAVRSLPDLSGNRAYVWEGHRADVDKCCTSSKVSMW